MHQPRVLHSVKPFDEPKKRSDYLPAGIAFIVLTGTLIWVFFSISPELIKNFLFPGSFLPLLVLLSLCFGSGLLFLTCHLRRSIQWALFLSAIIWFQLQHVLDVVVFLYLLLPFLFLEFVLTVLREK